MVFFYLMTTIWILTSSSAYYVRVQSIDTLSTCEDIYVIFVGSNDFLFLFYFSSMFSAMNEGNHDIKRLFRARKYFHLSSLGGNKRGKSQ